MRPHLFFAAALMVGGLGCTGRTAPLQVRDQIENPPEEDGGFVDAGFDGTGVDAGIIDSGLVIDAGVEGACGFGTEHVQRLSVVAEEDFYDGPAFLLSRDPIDMQLDDGSVARFDFGQLDLPVDLEPGASVWLQFVQDQPQWQNNAVAISTDEPGLGGRLRFAAWSFGDVGEFELDFGSVTGRYERADCVPVDLLGCGPVAPLVLRVTGPAVEDAPIPAGTVGFFRTMVIGNGRSHEYPSFPECTDTPRTWLEGYISVF